jgi:DNA-binding IclR family transcriptional regulator
VSETTAGTEAAARVADVLLLFTDGPSTLGVTRIARVLGLSKAVVHRILQSLATRGIVTLDPASREYRLGSAAAALGARALRDSDLRSAALTLLRELRDATHETATLTSLVPHGRVYLDQVEGAHEIKMTVELGRRFPLHAGGSGKCMLAFLPEQLREHILTEPLEALTANTVTDAETLRAECKQIRNCGYATSGGERQGDAGSVAAPLFDVSGEVVAAISVCGPRYRVTPAFVEEIAPQVVEAAGRISRRLGWRG